VARRFFAGLAESQSQVRNQAKKTLALLSLYHRRDVLAAMQRAVRCLDDLPAPQLTTVELAEIRRESGRNSAAIDIAGERRKACMYSLRGVRRFHA